MDVVGGRVAKLLYDLIRKTIETSVHNIDDTSRVLTRYELLKIRENVTFELPLLTSLTFTSL